MEMKNQLFLWLWSVKVLHNEKFFVRKEPSKHKKNYMDFHKKFD